MYDTQSEYDPRYSRSAPFNSGEAAYDPNGKIFHVLKVYWSPEHKQWAIDLYDVDEKENIYKRSCFQLMNKRQFFTRKIKA